MSEQIYSILEAQERKKIQAWKGFTNTFKHYCLMYVYRLHTDSENILDYVETFKFLQSGLSADDLPLFIAQMKPEELKREAYEVIGRLGDLA